MKMFKLFAAFCAVVMTGSLWASGDVDYGMFKNIPETIAAKSVIGARFGLPCSISSGMVEGGEFSLCYSATDRVYGFKYALLGVNNGSVIDGAEVAFVNFANKLLKGVQVGFYNSSAAGGVQIGLVNTCDNDAAFQLGLINVNKNGWLPFMLFFNLGSDSAE